MRIFVGMEVMEIATAPNWCSVGVLDGSDIDAAGGGLHVWDGDILGQRCCRGGMRLRIEVQELPWLCGPVHSSRQEPAATLSPAASWPTA